MNNICLDFDLYTKTMENLKSGNITHIMQQIHKNAKEKGFHDRWYDEVSKMSESEKTSEIGLKMMLIVSELGEAIEALRNNKRCADIKSVKKFNFEKECKDTFEDEIADTIIRILDLCGLLNIDIEEHIRKKMEYNSSRKKLHGKEF